MDLHFGFNPSATAGIDPGLDEYELPPLPPMEAFDARFIGDDIGTDLGQGVMSDFRPVTALSSVNATYELRYQVGKGTVVVIRWCLGDGVSYLFVRNNVLLCQVASCFR